MVPKDLQSLIAQLEITTKKHISGPLLGDAQSRLKGSGFEFSQLREYAQGDDIRYIDWKASARSNSMLVRQYLEDRNRMLYLAVDVSKSSLFGTTKDGTKKDLMNTLAAVLSFVGLHRKDSVGLLLFTDTVEKIIPPRQSRSHIFSLVQEIYSFVPSSAKTDFRAPLEHLARMSGPKALVFIVSDFLSPLEEYGSLLKVVSQRHDVLAIRCLDPRENRFPEVGTLVFEDFETGTIETIESSSSQIEQALLTWHVKQKEQLQAARIDSLDIEVGSAYKGSLVRFLRQRMLG